MNYIVTSDVFTPKEKGESITEKELLELGLNIDALVAGGHLKNNAVIKPVEEVK